MLVKSYSGYWKDYKWLITIDEGNMFDTFFVEEFKHRKDDLIKAGVDFKVTLGGGLVLKDEKMAAFYAIKWSARNVDEN